MIMSNFCFYKNIYVLQKILESKNRTRKNSISCSNIYLAGSVMVAASLYSVGYNRAISENEGLRYNIISLEIIIRNVLLKC